MGLDEAEVGLIRAAWIPARKDPVGAGVLLFKGLFTKFPDYLRLFNQFDNLDVERLSENKRLVRHAVKVIETVTFVVDSIGDPAKGDQLNEALVALVRGHLKRKIGLNEFRNLGIVLIDFICDLNNRRPTLRAAPGNRLQPTAPFRGTNSSVSSSQDSETMTSTLDKIRASSSPSSSSEDESLLARTSNASLEDAAELHETRPTDRGTRPGQGVERESRRPDEHQGLREENEEEEGEGEEEEEEEDEEDEEEEEEDERRRQEAKLDTGLLVAAWTKLYGVILDLVKSEEGDH